MGRWSWAWQSPTKLLKLNHASVRRCRSHSPLWVDAGPWTDLSGEREHGHEVRVQNSYHRYSYSYYTYLKGFCGYSFSLCIQLTHITDSGEQVATHLFTHNKTCIDHEFMYKINRVQAGLPCSIGEQFFHKRCSFSVRLPGEVLRRNRDPAGHCPKPLAASAFLLPVMHLGAMWVPGRCGAGAWTTSDCSLVQAWRWTGVSLTGLQLYSPKQNQHLSLSLSSSVGRPWPLAAHQQLTAGASLGYFW